MKRTAILANANPSNAAGALQDLKLWHSFLISPVGGAWLDRKEIHVLPGPSKEDILNLVRPAISDDYVIVVVFGHGELRKDRLGFPETFISLNGSEAISERELNPRNERCTIFIDLGRNEAGNSIAIPSHGLDEIRLSRCRESFDSEIVKAETGCAKVQAANLNSESPHKTSFSATLIDQSIQWAQRDHGTLNLHQAISLTSEVFNRTPLLKGPRLQAGRRLHQFPFAVNPKD